MFHRSLSAVLTVAFAAVSLLGHGGLHLLPGGHDCHQHAPAAERADAHHHAHHHGCSHSHDHGHSHGATDAAGEPPAPAPSEHDHNDCVVCQWRAQGQLTTVDVVVPCDEARGDEAVLPAAQITTAFRLATLLTRGPPSEA